MDRKFLGDSYDCVKRLWRELLQPHAPLFAEGRFIPEDLREDYTRFTGIPILAAAPPANHYSILNDPSTGIRYPNGKTQTEGRTHIRIATIIEQLNQENVFCVITFDQGFTRGNRDAQMREKLNNLGNGGYAFYYRSHAPFFFAFKRKKNCSKMRRILREAGMPDQRILPQP